MLNQIAIGLVKTLLSSGKRSQTEELASELYYLLSTFVFQRGQLKTFQDLMKRIMTVVSALPKEDVPTAFLHELWAYKCLMTSSALLTLGKHGSVAGEANQAVKVLQHGATRRSAVPAFLLQARNSQKLDNNQAASFLDKADDEPSIGREIIVALGYYAHQAYKDFYLLAMGLVAACKA